MNWYTKEIETSVLGRDGQTGENGIRHGDADICTGVKDVISISCTLSAGTGTLSHHTGSILVGTGFQVVHRGSQGPSS